MNSSNKKIKILVVDDHQVLRHGLISLLSHVDSIEIVGEAGNGKQALDFLEEYAVDVVLLDIEMPVMNGNETLIKIIEKYPNIKVIMFTMHHSLGYESHFLKLGAKAFLAKNCGYEIISETILKICNNPTGVLLNDTMKISISDRHLRQSLNERELEVLRLMCKDLNNVQISKTLSINKYTAKYIRKIIHDKTRTQNLSELIIYAYEEGLIPIN